jgi:tetratricopeptide (TPR) repeat protein
MASPRLAHVSPRFASSKRAELEKNETYAVTYFKNNPDAVVDTRPPEDKLAELTTRLEDYDLETTDKFTILIHQKSLNYILYGETSIEALRSHLALGVFYGDNHRPVSALRHLQKVASLKQNYELERTEEITLAVETADAHLQLRSDNRVESQKHINQAAEVIKSVQDEDIEDPLLKYRRDLVKSRILAARGRVENAMRQYEITLESLSAVTGGEDSNMTAKLYLEIAQTAEAAKDTEKAGDFYARSYQMFSDLGMEESAAAILPKVPKERLDDL